MTSRRITVRRFCIRLAQLAVAAKLGLSLAACTCPPPLKLDGTFLLDGRPGTPLDAGTAGDGGMMSMTTPATPAGPPPVLDCTPAAAGCVPGGPCLAACNCVLTRDKVVVLAVESCTLLAGSGPPQVQIRYEQSVFCGE
jgi:hypothetical protein